MSRPSTHRRAELFWYWPASFLKTYVVGGSLVLAFVFLVYTQSVVNRMERQSLAMVRVLKSLLEVEAEDTTDAPISRLHPVFFEVESALRAGIPVIITDEEERVLFSTGVRSVPGRHVSEQPPELRKALWRMCKRSTKVPLRDSAGEVMGYLHWGEHRLIRELQWIPPLELVVVSAFLLVALVGLRQLKAVEQRSLWYGMAREAAHQLGTPISSLMGWVELLRAKTSDEVLPEVAQVVGEMARDVDRLARIARRFERMGQPPKLEIIDVGPVLEETASYFQARIPQREGGIRLVVELGPLKPVRANRDLLMWVLENLVRNSLEALHSGGTVTLRAGVEPRGGHVSIQVEDTGKGMSLRVRSMVFRTGFSTKPRGWGIGLAMAKRIIEEGHGGRLRVLRSSPGKGTVMEILLPAHDGGKR